MASTVTLQNVTDWARTYTKLIPIIGVGGFANEPALSICNNVIQAFLTRPYAWPFNRKTLATPIDTVDKQQDYTLTGVADIGWIERGYVEEKAFTGTPKPIKDLEIVRALPKDSVIGARPFKICKDRESGAGNVDTIVRVWPLPGTVIWTVNLDYQIKAPLKTTMTGAGTGDWSPIPDELTSVIRQGFLAEALKHADDNRAMNELNLFYAMLRNALGFEDVGVSHQGFVPDRALMMG